MEFDELCTMLLCDKTFSILLEPKVLLGLTLPESSLVETKALGLSLPQATLGKLCT